MIQVDAATFHDIFEVARKYTKNGELVDLHGIQTTEDSVVYDQCANYLSADGMSGFSVTPDGDLISFFNAHGREKPGFLRAIAPIVKEKVKTLDCYMSLQQPLHEIYEKVFGMQVASVMDHNVDYDHDGITANHSEPKVAFMVNTDANVETRFFGKDDYDAAMSYRDSLIDQQKASANASAAATGPNPSVGAADQGFDPYSTLQFPHGNKPDRAGTVRDISVADYLGSIVPKTTTNDKPGRKKGVVRGEGVSIYDLMKTFNDVQGKAFQYLNTVAEITGIDIVLYRSEAGPDGKFQGAQGRYSRSEPGTIYIDLNAGLSDIKSADDLAKYAMLRTFAHEFTHFIENWNPAQYSEFREVVFDTLAQRGENVQDLIEDKMARNPGMSPDMASREVVAEAMTDILPDSGFVQELAVKHQDLFHRLTEKLKAFVSNLRQYFDTIGQNPAREANALKEQVGDTVKYLDSIVQLFDQMAVQAVENYQQAVTAEEVALDSAGNDDVQYQRRDRQKYSYKNISQQEYRQIQEDRMEKYGDHFDEMPVIDYTHAHDLLYVFENFDETRFGVLERIDPAKNKTKADIVVEAFENGPIQNIQDLNGRITRLRNFQKLRSVYHSSARNRGASTGNAGLGTETGGSSNGSGLSETGNGNQVQHQQRTDTLTDREVLAMAAGAVSANDLTADEKDALRACQARHSELEALQKQLWEQQIDLEKQQGQKAAGLRFKKRGIKLHHSKKDSKAQEVLAVEKREFGASASVADRETRAGAKGTPNSIFICSRFIETCQQRFSVSEIVA